MDNVFHEFKLVIARACSLPWIRDWARIIIGACLFQLPLGYPETIEHWNHTEGRIEVKLRSHKLSLGNVTLDSDVSYDRKHAGQELSDGVDAADLGGERPFKRHVSRKRNRAKILALQTMKVTFNNVSVGIVHNLIKRT
jgi:hypothetical protein